MGTDFFDELGETLSRTAREFGERAGSLYETQKLRTKIAGEEHAVNKAMAELGKTLYRAYRNGQELTEEQKGWCEQIDQHKEIISRYKAEMAGKKGKKICPSCGEAVDLSVSFCPYCGAACGEKKEEEAPAKETEVMEEDASEENAETSDDTVISEEEETAEKEVVLEEEETAEKAVVLEEEEAAEKEVVLEEKKTETGEEDSEESEADPIEVEVTETEADLSEEETPGSF